MFDLERSDQISHQSRRLMCSTRGVGIGDVVSDSHIVEQNRVIGTESGSESCPSTVGLDPNNLDGAFFGSLQAGAQPKESALSCPVGPGENHKARASDAEASNVENRVVSVDDAHSIDLIAVLIPPPSVPLTS